MPRTDTVSATTAAGSEVPVTETAVVDVPGELRALSRDVDAADGIQRMLRRVARRLDSSAVLVEPSDATVPAGRPIPAVLAADVHAVRTGRATGIAADLDGRPVCVLPVTTGTPRPVLVVRGRAAGRRFTPAERALLAEACVPLGLAWRDRALRQRAARLDRAEAVNREAVLYQLQDGNVAAARRAAAVLGPDLPELIRVHIVECSDRRVAETLRWCRDVAAEWAWVVRCPVYRQHVVVVARADADPVVDVLRHRAGDAAAYHVGSSEELPLADCGTGYLHAFHALAVARHRPGRYAAFRGRGELSAVLAGTGSGWAARTLAPLLSYRPSRPQDPDSPALVRTLTSWLTFHGLAARHLKVHRNTLTARLRLIGSLLGVDLRDVGTQATLYLALQLVGPSGGPEVSLAELLAQPEALHWAEQQCTPLRGSDPRLVGTLRTWLDNRARIGPTAAALGVSQSGVRKRIARVEQLIQRSLLDSPSARYDLYFALTDTRPTAGW